MGVFVSMYNFFGFRAVLGTWSSARAGLVYVVYLSGTWSSARAGALSRRYGRGVVVMASAAMMLLGALAVAASSLWIAFAGLLTFTASFFALHSTASGRVGLIAERDRAEASSMYVPCYYMGSSILGAATGWAYEGLPWAGFVAVLAALLGALALVAAALWKGAR